MPDAVIATHVFAAQVLNELKSQGVLRMPLIGVITDYCIHPFWEECTYIDYIVTASELLHYSAKKKGMNMERVLPFGIPIKPGFLRQVPKETARRMLGLNTGQRTILVMALHGLRKDAACRSGTSGNGGQPANRLHLRKQPKAFSQPYRT
jgi:processive 1,2-diacylglycerol beta-glucosyltransferase